MCPITWATTYYADATNGNDSNSGISEVAAWKTVAKVNYTTFNPGDQILFKRDQLWREQLITSSSGSLTNPITYGAYGNGNRPIITGLNLIVPGAPWTLDSGNIWKATVTIEPKVVVFNSTLGINVTSKSGITGAHKWWWSTNVLYIYSDSIPDRSYVNPGIQVGTRDWAINVTKNYITIDNLEVGGGNVRWRGGIHIESDGVHHCTIQNCEFRWNAGGGVAFGQKNGGDNLVRSCLFHHNGLGVISDKDTGPTPGHENYFQHNRIYQNLYDGIQVNGNYWIVEYNEVYDNGGNTGEYIGIHIYTSQTGPASGSYNIIRYNIVYNQKGSGNDGAGIAIDQWCNNNQVYYNISYNNDGPGIYCYDAANNKIYNNTVYGNCLNSSGGLLAKGEIRLTSTIADLTTNIEVKNNIAYATQPNTYAIYIDNRTSDNILDIANNCWYSTATDWYYRNNSGGNNLPAWNEFTGVTNNINSDPKFLTPGVNFRLQSTSLCINTGTDVGLIMDYEGTPIKGAVTIGAYQYAAKPEPPANFRTIN